MTEEKEKPVYEMSPEEMAVAETAAMDAIYNGSNMIKQATATLRDIHRERFIRALTPPKRRRSKSSGDK